MGFSAVVKGNNSPTVLLDTQLHADDATDSSKQPWHKYLKGQQSKNNHPYNPPASLSAALDNMRVVTELMAGLCILLQNTEADINCPTYFYLFFF